MVKMIAAVAVALLLGACQTTRYEMAAPTSDAGRACVTQCAGIREACRGNEILRAKSEREACERRSAQAVHACVAKADSKDKQKECEKNKSSCWSFEDYDRCDDEHRACFAQCGGRVSKIVE